VFWEWWFVRSVVYHITYKLDNKNFIWNYIKRINILTKIELKNRCVKTTTNLWDRPLFILTHWYSGWHFLATLWTSSSSFKVINFKVFHQKLEKLWEHKSNKQIQEKKMWWGKMMWASKKKSNCSPIMESKMDTTTSIPSSLAHLTMDSLSQCFFETLVSSLPLLSRLLRSFQKLMSYCSPIAKYFEVSLLNLNVNVFSLS
jgi:hypothetical protein